MTASATVRALVGAPDRWRHLVQHTPDERVYELVHRDDEVEVHVTCWMDGHDTGFHDHDGPEPHPRDAETPLEVLPAR